MTLAHRSFFGSVVTTGGTGALGIGADAGGMSGLADIDPGNAAEIDYVIYDGAQVEWGVGTVNSAGTSFTRDTISGTIIADGTRDESSPAALTITTSGAVIKWELASSASVATYLSTVNQYLATTSNVTFSTIGRAAIDKIVASSASVLGVFLDDVRTHNDGGAWVKKTQHTSWYNETLNTATRGATREYPALVLWVAESDTVTAYDATKADTPMWMVFPGASNNALNLPSGTVTSVSALNGEIIVGMDGGRGIARWNYITEVIRWTTASVDAFYKSNFKDRNSASDFIDSGTGEIVNSTVNDAAITTLSGAETDTSTGLPYPTIAVPTAGGGSWINRNGTLAKVDEVIDATAAINLVDVALGDDGFTVWCAADKGYIFETIPSIDTALTSADYTFDTAGTSGPHISGTITSVVLHSSDGSGNAVFTVGTNEGIFTVDYVTGGTTSGISQITKDFNAPNQYGDVRGCWLANSKTLDRSVKGNDLTENGTVTFGEAVSGSGVYAASGFSASNYLSRAYDADFDFGTGDFCVGVWIKFTGSGGTIFDRANWTGAAFSGSAIRLFGSGGTLRFQISDDGFATSDLVATTVTFNDGNWHLFFAVRDGATLRVYADGVEHSTGAVTNAAGSLSNASALLEVGRRADAANFWDDSIAPIRISAYALTAAQIRKIYNAEKWLFRENALARLQGTSDAVSGLSLDTYTNKLDAATANGTTTVTGLLPIDFINTDDTPTSNTHLAVSRVDDRLALATAAEVVFTRAEETL